MSKNNPALAIITLAAVCLSFTFLKDRVVSDGGEPATEFIRISKLPPIDPNGPLPSPGAFVVRRLAEIDPAVAAALADQVEASERGVMQQMIAAKSVSE